MLRSLLTSLVLLTAAPAKGCPEIVVPLDTRDPAFRSAAWRSALGHYKRRRHGRALAVLRKRSKTLTAEVERLFRPAAGEEPEPNRVIQRWLKKHVTTRNPGVLIHGDRFTYPAAVWWAWADVSCRAGLFDEAALALRRLRELRPGGDLRHHEAIVALRRGRLDRAREALRAAPPDAFLTPYAQGLLARADGDDATFRTRMAEALKATDLDDRRDAVRRELSEKKVDR